MSGATSRVGEEAEGVVEPVETLDDRSRAVGADQLGQPRPVERGRVVVGEGVSIALGEVAEHIGEELHAQPTPPSRNANRSEGNRRGMPPNSSDRQIASLPAAKFPMWLAT